MTLDLNPEDAAEFARLRDESEKLGRQVDIFLGVYPGESSIKTKWEAYRAMARLNAILAQINTITDRYKTN